MRDAFLTERDAHYVRDADYVCDARLRRVSGTHRITYHSEAASLITCLQNKLIRGIIRTKYIDEQTFKTLSAKCTSLRAMLIASCRTAKENTK